MATPGAPLHLTNPGVERSDLVARLRRALAAARAGTRCTCGGPIRVSGSAEAGLFAAFGRHIVTLLEPTGR